MRSNFTPLISLILSLLLAACTTQPTVKNFDIGPISIDKVSYPLPDYKVMIDKYISQYAQPLEKRSYSLTEAVSFNKFGKPSYLVCATTDKNEQLFSYPGPYAFIVKKDSVYSAGGGYLCNQKVLAKGAEYRLVRAVSPRLTKKMVKEGVNGKVTVEFTVNEKGKAENIFITTNTTGNIDAGNVSITALKRFIFQPRIINNKAYKVYGVRNKFTF